jgi:hypothetical protein
VNGFWEFFWFMVVTFFFVAYLLIMFQIIIDIFRDRTTSGGVKAVWVVALIFLPVLTAIVYLVVQGQGMAERQIASAQSAQADAESYIRSVAGGGGSASDEIARAKALLDSGTINADEFAQLKAKALSGS